MSMKRPVWFAMVVGNCVLLAGCHGSGPRMDSATGERPVVLKTAQQADLQVAMGRSLEKGGTPDQAAAVYQDALKKDPKRADALDRLAVLHARKGQFDQAIPLHKKALTLQPSNPDFLCNLGYCYYLQQRWTDAEVQFRKAIDLMPDHPRALNNLGLVLAHTNRNDLALVAFRRGGCSEADAHSNLAFVLTLENSWQEAQHHYAHARQLDPTSSAAAKGLQVVTARLGAPVATSADTPGKTDISAQPTTATNMKAGQETPSDPNRAPTPVTETGFVPQSENPDMSAAPRFVQPAVFTPVPPQGTIGNVELTPPGVSGHPYDPPPSAR